MVKYQKQTSVTGNWVKAAELKNGIRAKLVSETTPQPSQFLDSKGNAKTQDVAKVRFEGMNEVFNVSLNRATVNALVDAFGDESSKWQGNYLKVETEKVRVAGRAVTALYLIPDGYEKVDDANGYAMIIKKGSVMQAQEVNGMSQSDEVEIPVIEEDTDLSNVPF